MNDPTEDQFAAYQLFRIEGRNREEVGAMFGVSGRTIHTWSMVVAEWMKNFHREQIANLRTTMTEKLEYLYRESMQSFRLSQNDKVVTTEKTVSGGYVDRQTGEYVDTQTEETTVQRTPQKSGNAAFLNLAITALKHQMMLWEAAMETAERKSDARAVGKTQEQLIADKIKQLTAMKRSLRSPLTACGDGDRA